MTSLLLFISIAMLVCTLFKKLTGRLGIPALLTFMILGMLFGSDGVLKVAFENYEFAEQISSIALAFIMFYGGFGTNWNAARPVAVISIILSSAGTVITAVLTGAFCHFVLGMPILEALLCGAVLGSTDAASVFSILRSRRLALKENTDSLLEVESGSNDPFAYMLTAVILSAMETGITPAAAAGLLMKQLFLGVVLGFGVGLLIRYVMREHRFDTSGIETIFVAASALFGYAAPAMLGGNGFLSVYIVGIIVGNSKFPAKAEVVSFFDGVTGIMQTMLFFLLGLLSFPSQIMRVLVPALAIALFLTFIARPAAVLLLMAPFRGSFPKRVLVSFAGLRGAASIVFAITTVLSPVKLENDLFHIVFGVVLFSISLQGSLLPFAARKLGMIDEEGDVLKTFTDYVDETPVNFIQFEIDEEHAWCGKTIAQLVLPPGSILVHLRRGTLQMVPKGDTCLQAGDVLVMCALERGDISDLKLTEKVVRKDDLRLGTSLADLPHDKGALIILVQRGQEYLIPDGNTVIQAGDRLLINHREEKIKTAT